MISNKIYKMKMLPQKHRWSGSFLEGGWCKKRIEYIKVYDNTHYVTVLLSKTKNSTINKLKFSTLQGSTFTLFIPFIIYLLFCLFDLFSLQMPTHTLCTFWQTLLFAKNNNSTIPLIWFTEIGMPFRYWHLHYYYNSSSVQQHIMHTYNFNHSPINFNWRILLKKTNKFIASPLWSKVEAKWEANID